MTAPYTGVALIRSAGLTLCVLRYMGGLSYFHSFQSIQKEFLGRVPSFIYSGMEDECAEMQKKSPLSSLLYATLETYRMAGGKENCAGFILKVMKDLGGIPCEAPEVTLPRWEGLYGLPEGMEEDQYLAFIQENQSRKPVIGILLHFHNIQHDNTKHIDALIQAVHEQGGLAIAFFSNIAPTATYPGLRGTLEKYLLPQGKPLIDALIVTTGHSLSALSAPGEGASGLGSSVFSNLDVPVLQAMYTFFGYEQWKQSLSGVDPMLLCSNVYHPEFDAQLITTVIAYSQAITTPFGTEYKSMPIPDRVAKVVRLGLNWARLRRKPMNQRKVAIILHNMPPRADMIGCAYGLDTPASVFNMIRALQEQGLYLDYTFRDGKDIIHRIIQGLTNDGRFLSAQQLEEGCAAHISAAVWKPWFDKLPDRVVKALTKDWGEAPGDVMTLDSRILVPGILNGNLFIGLQPPRAFEEKAEESYHSTDMVCPWQYIAYYRWVEHTFGADVVVHVGTHGTLEWLPGKETGLSHECYPDIVLGTLPHLYPYIIDVPGEGAQAKRRSGAAIIDHLIPSMTESGLYGELAGLEELITAYYHARITGSGKEKTLTKLMWDLVVAHHLHQDLSLREEDFFSHSEASIEKIHLWLETIKSSKIKNGLHIFGQVPQDKRYTNMLRLLVSTKNNGVPSLREAICSVLGEDLPDLLENPQKLRAGLGTNSMVLDTIDEYGRELYDTLEKKGFTPEQVDELVQEWGRNYPPERLGPLKACLNFCVRVLKPKLDATGDELAYFIRGIEGRFIPPGASGAPSRGNAGILPTGRNFYMIDPSAVPSRAAWETGTLLGAQLLERYRADNGQLPESIIIVVYSGETIKTTGDDIAEILFLYGVRPIWIGTTNHVSGLEAIPLEELGRPRIDVTLRISGLFRDTFPNLIERIEDAVNLIASLPEPLECNFVKKHIMRDMAELSKQGVNPEEAGELASLRVFGCPPGSYGAGVDILVNSKKWETPEDLGKGYINWSAHAYSRNRRGTKRPDIFAQRLRTCDLTVKNISSWESDMLDDDDYYNYHGGLISAVTSVKGSQPVSYSTNAGDPEHPATSSIHEDVSRIMRARINNPAWIAGLQKHGFKGAQEFAAMVDIVFGWDATSGVIDDWMYDSIAEAYLLHEELCNWIKEHNPHALHAISERLLEAEKRGMWNPPAETLERIRQIYLAVEGDLEGLS